MGAGPAFHATREEAVAEACIDDNEPEGVISAERGHRSTPSLVEASRATREMLGDGNVLDALLSIWCAAETDLDGVWWADDLDPALLSAPRGCIPASAVADWRFRPTDFEPEDEFDCDEEEEDA